MTAPGALIWAGPSRVDGSPVAVVLTWATVNRKAGDMAQTWILRSDLPPSRAVQTGDDHAICGSCPLRGTNGGKGRLCYVVPMHGPRGVFGALQAGRYPRTSSAELRARLRYRQLRLGAYGDPGAVPTRVWERLAGMAEGWTGYTHLWRSRASLKRFCMASVESREDAREAQSQGWRTFRIRGPSAAAMRGERICPAAAEAGRRLTCSRCGDCNGARGRGRRSVVIIAHGGHLRRSWNPGGS